MLRASYTYHRKASRRGTGAGGVMGDHAWVGVVDGGFILHAYFNLHEIRFVLYGPAAAGREKMHGDPCDGGGLSGELDVQTLKQVLRLLDRGGWPRQFVRENAKRCDVVRD